MNRLKILRFLGRVSTRTSFDIFFRLGTSELLSLASQAVVEARLSPLNDSVKTDELFDSDTEEIKMKSKPDEEKAETDVDANDLDKMFSNFGISNSDSLAHSPAKIVSESSHSNSCQGTPQRHSLPSNCCHSNNDESLKHTPQGKSLPGRNLVDAVTSTPANYKPTNHRSVSRQKSHVMIPEGNYCGQCRHRDGNPIGK